jgi:hypothetical protein
MNVGYPNGAGVRLQTRESDMPVVMKITEKVKAEGVKGHYCKRSPKNVKTNIIDRYGS